MAHLTLIQKSSSDQPLTGTKKDRVSSGKKCHDTHTGEMYEPWVFFAKKF